MFLPRLFKTVLVCWLLSLTAQAAYVEAVGIDKPAPLFSAKALDGNTVDLAGLYGQTVVLEWTRPECPFVAKHYDSGSLQNLQRSAAAKGIVWLQLIPQGHADGGSINRINAERGARPAHVVFDTDGAIGKLYGVTNTPQFFIIDAHGVLVYQRRHRQYSFCG